MFSDKGGDGVLEGGGFGASSLVNSLADGGKVLSVEGVCEGPTGSSVVRLTSSSLFPKQSVPKLSSRRHLRQMKWVSKTND